MGQKNQTSLSKKRTSYMYDFLPFEIKSILLSDESIINELRIRENRPVTANYNGIYKKLYYCGKSIVLSHDDIGDIVFKACENSVYAYNDCIKEGYISYGGIRIGLCGRFVLENGNVKTMKDFSGLCIRIPHEIKGCAERIFDALIINDLKGDLSRSRIKSALIISPPGVGKTTFLRDITRVISEKTHKNVLVIDEKNEISGREFDLGESSDVLLECDKRFGFYTAIKTLCPDVLIADELTNATEADGALFAKLSGVTVICSVHAENYRDALKKDYLKNAFKNGCFDLFITLKREGEKVSVCEIGEIE